MYSVAHYLTLTILVAFRRSSLAITRAICGGAILTVHSLPFNTYVIFIADPFIEPD